MNATEKALRAIIEDAETIVIAQVQGGTQESRADAVFRLRAILRKVHEIPNTEP